METVEHKDPLTGRLYRALQEGEHILIQGPPQELMEQMGLPEPFATHLHNILYRRGILTYQDVMRRGNELRGALQEAYNLDAQRLTEAFYHLQKEEVQP